MSRFKSLNTTLCFWTFGFSQEGKDVKRKLIIQHLQTTESAKSRSKFEHEQANFVSTLKIIYAVVQISFNMPQSKANEKVQVSSLFACQKCMLPNHMYE